MSISADRSCGATQRHGTGADASVDRAAGEMQGSFLRKRQADVDDYDSEEDLDYVEETQPAMQASEPMVPRPMTSAVLTKQLCFGARDRCTSMCPRVRIVAAQV